MRARRSVCRMDERDLIARRSVSGCRACRRWQWTYEVQEKEKRGKEEGGEWEGLEFGTGREEEGAQGVGHGVGGDAIATRLSYGGGAGRGRRTGL
jgi:hypothetical protein